MPVQYIGIGRGAPFSTGKMRKSPLRSVIGEHTLGFN